MAKMFYNLDEAAAKLGMNEDEVHELAKSGRIQEFRDRDKLMFKVEQIDLIADGSGAGDEELGLSLEPLADDGLGLSAEDTGDGSAISLEPLDGSGDGSGLGSGLGSGIGSGLGSGLLGSSIGSGLMGSSSGSSVGLDAIGDSSERSGISIFDADDLDTADPAAMTQMTDDGFGDLSLDSVGSGSGLMDLTRESDDTSLGAEFLDEVYPGDDGEEGGGGLFDGGDAESSPAGTGGATLVASEPYDGAGSGFVGGLALAMVVALAASIAIVGTALVGANGDNPVAGLGGMFADQLMMVAGGLGGLAVVAAGLGFVIGKKTG